MTPSTTAHALRVNTLTVAPEQSEVAAEQRVTVEVTQVNGGRPPYDDHFVASARKTVLSGAVELWSTEIDRSALASRGVSLLDARISSFRHLEDRVEPEYANVRTTDAVNTLLFHPPLYTAYAAHRVSSSTASGELDLGLKAGGHTRHFDRQERRWAIVSQHLEQAVFRPHDASTYADDQSLSLVLVPRYQDADGSVSEDKRGTVTATLARQPDGAFAVGAEGKLLGQGDVWAFTTFKTEHTDRAFVGFRAALVSNDGDHIDSNQEAGYLIDVPDVEPPAI